MQPPWHELPQCNPCQTCCWKENPAATTLQQGGQWDTPRPTLPRLENLKKFHGEERSSATPPAQEQNRGGLQRSQPMEFQWYPPDISGIATAPILPPACSKATISGCSSCPDKCWMVLPSSCSLGSLPPPVLGFLAPSPCQEHPSLHPRQGDTRSCLGTTNQPLRAKPQDTERSHCRPWGDLREGGCRKNSRCIF